MIGFRKPKVRGLAMAAAVRPLRRLITKAFDDVRTLAAFKRYAEVPLRERENVKSFTGFPSDPVDLGLWDAGDRTQKDLVLQP